jgi:hypothetical protein
VPVGPSIVALLVAMEVASGVGTNHHDVVLVKTVEAVTNEVGRHRTPWRLGWRRLNGNPAAIHHRMAEVGNGDLRRPPNEHPP